MAEQYQLPPEFRPPSMAEISFLAGDQQGQEQETMNNFLRQWNVSTNIDNANRAQSLREKQFAQNIIESNRDFQLREELQDSNLRNNDIAFQIKQFAFDRDKENYTQLREAWMKRDQWVDSINNFLPEGGSSASYLDGKAKIFRMFAKNPADYDVLTALFKPYDDQFRVYQANRTMEDEAKVEEAFDAGLLDGEAIQDMDASAYWREAQMIRQADPVGYAGAVRNLLRIAKEKTQERERSAARQQEATDLGIFEARRIEAGLPTSKITYKDGKVQIEAGAPRVVGGRGSTGSAAYDRYINVLGERADAAAERIGELQTQIQSLPEGSAEQLLAQAELNDARRQYQYYTQEAETQAQALRSATVPQTEGGPTGQPSGAARRLGPLPKAPEIKPKTPPQAAPAQPPISSAPELPAREAPQATPVKTEAETILEQRGIKMPKAKQTTAGVGRKVQTSEQISQDKLDRLNLELDRLSKQKSGRSQQPNYTAIQRVAEEIASETRKLEGLRLLAEEKKKQSSAPQFAKTF